MLSKTARTIKNKLAYANDICILASTREVLQLLLLDICKLRAKTFGIVFTFTKPVHMVFSSIYKKQIVVDTFHQLD